MGEKNIELKDWKFKLTDVPCEYVHIDGKHYISREYLRLILDEKAKEIADLKRTVEDLQDQHQQDCIDINRLNVTVEVLADILSRFKNVSRTVE